MKTLHPSLLSDVHDSSRKVNRAQMFDNGLLSFSVKLYKSVLQDYPNDLDVQLKAADALNAGMRIKT